MPLQSELFKDDPKIVAAATAPHAHIREGQRGPHVGKIQMALLAVSNAKIADVEIDTQFYGPSTAAAVLKYKTEHNPPIINRAYQKQADDIVGIMTIAALDREIKQLEDNSEDDAVLAAVYGALAILAEYNTVIPRICPVTYSTFHRVMNAVQLPSGQG